MSTKPTETDQDQPADQPVGKPADILQPGDYSDFSDPSLAVTETENSGRLPKASDSFESSSEEEEDGSGGYMLLPQEAGEELQSDWPVEGGQESDWTTGELSCIPVLDEEDSKSEQSAATVGNERTELETANSDSLGATAASPTTAMEETKVQAIKQVMAQFVLPGSAVPQWAKVVPEDVWKAELIGGLTKKKK